MKEQILSLRKEGKNYNEIQKILGCSKGTISFHCGEGQKEKSKNRLKKYRKTFKGYLLRRICFFQKRDNLNKGYEKDRKLDFNVDEFIKKFGKITKCALTGRIINLEKDTNWDLDHIISKHEGGDNSLNNCQILLRDVNQMKHKLSEEQLIEYCKDILKYRNCGVV